MLEKSFELSIKQIFKAPIKKVFDAWTKPEQLAVWYGPEGFASKVYEFDFRFGGKYRITMTNAKKGEAHTVEGEFKKINPPHDLSFTWHWAGSPNPPSEVKIKFIEQGDKTEMQFRHYGFVDGPDRDLHNKGWVSSFDKLSMLLS